MKEKAKVDKSSESKPLAKREKSSDANEFSSPSLHRDLQGTNTLLHNSPPEGHAALINKAAVMSPVRAVQIMTALQKNYGNRYVQRVVSLATKGGNDLEAMPGIESEIHGSRGSGEALDSVARTRMESAFGADFSRVRIHTGTKADGLNRALSARAFTTGHDIFFKEGEYNPASSAGSELLAHELTHVVQQGGGIRRKLTVSSPEDEQEQEADQMARAIVQRESQPEEEEEKGLLQAKRIECKSSDPLQRRILVGGKPYTPTAAYYKWLKDNGYGDAMVEFVKGMHNNGAAPDHPFTSFDKMGYEVRVRHNAIKGMGAVHTGCCGYPSGAGTGYLNSAYWDKKGPFQFTVKTSLPGGKMPSDAIDAIFAAGAGTELECNSMMVAIQYRAMLLAMGKAKFDAKFAGGAGIIISPHHEPPAGVALHPIWDKKLYKHIVITGASDLLPGDWVYFENISDYIVKHPGGAWSGEHAMYLGGGKFRGFGVSEMTEADLNKELLRVYNLGLPLAQQKNIGDVPGMRKYARRPVIAEIMK